MHGEGGVHGKGWCVAKGACVAGGMHGRGCVWQGHVWQERQPLQQIVCILLKRILVAILYLHNMMIVNVILYVSG